MKKRWLSIIFAMVMAFSVSGLAAAAFGAQEETPDQVIFDQAFNTEELDEAVWHNNGATLPEEVRNSLVYQNGAGSSMLVTQKSFSGPIRLEYDVLIGNNQVTDFNNFGIGLMPVQQSNPYTSGAILFATQEYHIYTPWRTNNTQIVPTTTFPEPTTVTLDIQANGDCTLTNTTNADTGTFAGLYAEEMKSDGYYPMIWAHAPASDTTPLTFYGVRAYQNGELVFEDDFQANNITAGKALWAVSNEFRTAAETGKILLPAEDGIDFAEGDSLISAKAFQKYNFEEAMTFSMRFLAKNFQGKTFDVEFGRTSVAEAGEGVSVLSIGETEVSLKNGAGEAQKQTVDSLAGKEVTVSVSMKYDGSATVTVNGKALTFTGMNADGYLGFVSQGAEVTLYETKCVQKGFVLYAPSIDTSKIRTKVYVGEEVNLMPTVTDKHDGTVVPTVKIGENTVEDAEHAVFDKAGVYQVSYTATNSVGKTTEAQVRVVAVERETQGSAAVNFNQGYYDKNAFVASTGTAVADGVLNIRSEAEGGFFATRGVAGRFLLTVDLVSATDANEYIALTFGRPTLSDTIDSGYMIRFVKGTTKVSLTNLTCDDSAEADIGIDVLGTLIAGKKVTLRLEVTGSDVTLGVCAEGEAIETLNVPVLTAEGVELTGLVGVSGGAHADFAIDNFHFISKGSVFEGNTEPVAPPEEPDDGGDGGDEPSDNNGGCGGCSCGSAAGLLGLTGILLLAGVGIKRMM